MADPTSNSTDSLDSDIELIATPKEKAWWLDSEDNVSKIVYGLYALGGILFLLDFAYHKHAYFNFENWFGFYAWYGFLSCVGLVFLAVPFRRLIKREESYYDS